MAIITVTVVAFARPGRTPGPAFPPLHPAAASAHQVAAAAGVKFRGGTGSCLIDDYVTRIGAHHYQEIACLVQGRTSASVIVAAAPAAMWAQARPLLLRAVASYLIR